MIVRFIQKEPLVWGPIFLLFSLALAVQISVPYDLLLLAAGGFFLSARMQIRGYCYALVLLGIVSVVRHVFLVHEHLWSLGIEGSLAIAFFITALTFEESANWIHSLKSQIQIRKSALENLEEEMAKVQESAQEQQIAFQEKVARLQKELEELQTEHSSILILNEVLRKTSARHLQEAQDTAAALKEKVIEIEQLKSEYNHLDQELICLKATDVWDENRRLMSELNQARYDKEQTHLINETLARLHLKECCKAKDAESESASLKEQLQAAHQEIQKLDAAALEFASQKSKADPNIAERLKVAEEKMLHLSQIEPLFKQLKMQFEMKNQVLHQVRADLFRSDTELQKLKMEKAALDLNPLSKEVEEEFEMLASQVETLEEENRELQELITALSNSPERKKKVKTQRPPEDQTFLF